MTDAELTRLAAEKVMGWPAFPMRDENGIFVHGYETASRPKLIENIRGEWIAHRENGEATRWQPLTDWRAAGDILDALADRNYNYTIECSGGLQRVYIENNRADAEGYGEEHFDGNNAPRSIVIAALRAVGAIDREGGAR